MTDSTRFNLLGDAFELFSLNSEEEIAERVALGGEDLRVFLLPSLTVDFALRAYDKNREECQEYYAVALIAAAFLTRKRGLPLSELLFDTPCGNVEVFCTGEGFLKIKIDKCKHILSSHTGCAGCDMKYNDFLVTKRIRAIHTEDVSLFSKSRLSEFAMLGSPFPVAVISSFSESGILKMNFCKDYSCGFASNLLLWCCAALNEGAAEGRSAHKFQLADHSAAVEVAPGSVTVEIEPIIL